VVQNSTNTQAPIASWHRNLLIIAAIFSVLLISMGGVLCATQSIRNCPDWPGCFGRVVPPMETGPILEYSHRLLAAFSGLLILSSAVAGLVRLPRVRWIAIPPVVAGVLLVEVSYFGAVVVLRGLAPGWAALDVGSALLVVALMVATAVTASIYKNNPSIPDRLSFKTPFTRLAMAAVAAIYVVLTSGILVSGKNSISGCLGWPIYSLRLFQLDGPTMGNTLRWTLSLVGIVLVVAVLLQAWRKKVDQPAVFQLARWLGMITLLEALVQVFLLVFGYQVSLMIIYSVTAAVFWALLVAVLVRASLYEVGS